MKTGIIIFIIFLLSSCMNTGITSPQKSNYLQGLSSDMLKVSTTKFPTALESVFYFNTPKDYELQVLKGRVKKIELDIYWEGELARSEYYIFDRFQNLKEINSERNKKLYDYMNNGYIEKYFDIDGDNEKLLSTTHVEYEYQNNIMYEKVKFTDEITDLPDYKLQNYIVTYKNEGNTIETSSNRDDLKSTYTITNRGIQEDIRIQNSSDIISSVSVVISSNGHIMEFNGILFTILKEDEKGNWIERTYFDDFLGKNVLEKRTIIYFNEK